MSTVIPQSFPLQKGINTILILALAAALLMIVLSGLGLIIPDQVYPDPEMADEFMTNDLVNLVIGLPLFLFSLFHIRRKNLIGLLLLPGALIYTIYNYFAYLLGKPFDWIGGLNLGLVLLCGYILFFLLNALDQDLIKEKLEGKTAEKLTSWILILFGLAFIVLALSEIIPGILDGSIPPLGEKAVSVADILVSIGWLCCGFALLQRRSLGYSLGLGFLLAASSLFIGLILYFFFASLLTGRALDWIEVLTVFVMGTISFGPTFLFIRGIVRSKKKAMAEPW